MQKLKKSLVPSILPAKEKVLSRYSSGKWKDYNTILESVAFEAGIYAHAKYDSKNQRHLMFPLDVWFVKDGQRMEETKMTLTFQPLHIQLGLTKMENQLCGMGNRSGGFIAGG